ncbi:hypothetical protein [Sphingomonas sp.]|jgi:hypothetical protein|uniref:hypothetical protein n=1 Tax=Sphingomonas sp. TaxID=28214 RepID=UPI002EDA31F3
MATAPEPSIDELNRQSARLEAESRKLRAEANKLTAEEAKLSAERYKLLAEQYKLERDKMLSPWAIVVQALIGGAALLAAALALLKYLAP